MFLRNCVRSSSRESSSDLRNRYRAILTVLIGLPDNCEISRVFRPIWKYSHSCSSFVERFGNRSLRRVLKSLASLPESWLWIIVCESLADGVMILFFIKWMIFGTGEILRGLPPCRFVLLTSFFPLRFFLKCHFAFGREGVCVIAFHLF